MEIHVKSSNRLEYKSKCEKRTSCGASSSKSDEVALDDGLCLLETAFDYDKKTKLYLCSEPSTTVCGGEWH